MALHLGWVNIGYLCQSCKQGEYCAFQLDQLGTQCVAFNILSTTEATPERLAGRATGDDETAGSKVTNTLCAFAETQVGQYQGEKTYHALASSFSIVYKSSLLEYTEYTEQHQGF